MTCSCRSDSSTRARRRRMASSGTTPASAIGWPGSGGARSWSRRPSAWWTSASPCSLASPETTGSPTSYLCWPNTLLPRSGFVQYPASTLNPRLESSHASPSNPRLQPPAPYAIALLASRLLIRLAPGAQPMHRCVDGALRMRTPVILTLLALTGAARAAPVKAVVFDLELLDMSQEAATGARADEARRIALTSDELRSLLKTSGQFDVIDTAPQAAAIL